MVKKHFPSQQALFKEFNQVCLKMNETGFNIWKLPFLYVFFCENLEDCVLVRKKSVRAFFIIVVFL